MRDDRPRVGGIAPAHPPEELEEGGGVLGDPVVGPRRVLVLLHLATVGEAHLA